MAPLRKLNLHSLDDVIAEVKRLRDDGYTPRGKWNLSQVADHLVETARVGLDGDMPRLPWVMRKIGGVMLRRAMRTRSMPRGLPTSARLTPEPLSKNDPVSDDPAKIDRLLATLAEARDFAGPLPPYPLMDGLTLEGWKDLMVVHSQHHLRFLEPGTTSDRENPDRTEALILGTIVSRNNQGELDYSAWDKLIDDYPQLKRFPSRFGVNPFNGKPTEFTPAPGGSRVFLSGSEVGYITRAVDGSETLIVEAHTGFEEPVRALAIELADQINCVFRPDRVDEPS